MISRNSVFFLGGFLCALLISIIFIRLNYISEEGFNPTDDGVVLAQSFRLLNGEIPHRDFISIRPCLSGLIHTINFKSPLPLEVSGRLFSLVEFFLYSFIFAWLLWLAFSFTFFRNINVFIYFILTGIAAFTINLNVFMFYPWTTIDGILLSILSFIFLFFAVSGVSGKEKSLGLSFVAIFISSLAPLCKQNFIIITLFTIIIAAFSLRRIAKFGKLVCIILSGLLPLIVYLGMVLHFGVLKEFLLQMLGRHEYVSLGIYPFLRTFFNSKVFMLNAWILAAVFYLWICRIKGRPLIETKDVSGKPLLKVMLIGILSIYLGYAVYTSFTILYERDYLIVPFELFWMLLCLYAGSAYFIKIPFRISLTVTFIIVLAWASSFSLGVNSPLFVTGLLLVTLLYYIFYLVKEGSLCIIDRSVKLWFQLLMIAVVTALFLFSLWNQKKFNYRDRPSKELTCTLGKLMPGFGNIRTNPVTYDYYRDFLAIYNSFIDKGIKDHFVLLPNNAIIYPMMNSRNPFPVDWIYRDEYLGSEKQTAK